jgi:hypothetical protein
MLVVCGPKEPLSMNRLYSISTALVFLALTATSIQAGVIYSNIGGDSIHSSQRRESCEYFNRYIQHYSTDYLSTVWRFFRRTRDIARKLDYCGTRFRSVDNASCDDYS